MTEQDADVPAVLLGQRSVFGEDAFRLRRGELALAIKGRALKLVPGPAAAPLGENGGGGKAMQT